MVVLKINKLFLSFTLQNHLCELLFPLCPVCSHPHSIFYIAAKILFLKTFCFNFRLREKLQKQKSSCISFTQLSLMLYKCSTIIKTKKLKLVHVVKSTIDLIQISPAFLQCCFSVPGSYLSPTLHLVAAFPQSPPICDILLVFSLL